MVSQTSGKHTNYRLNDENMRNCYLSLLIVLSLFCSCQNKGNGVLSVTGSVAEQADSLWLPLDSIIKGEYTNVHTCVSEDGNLKFYCWNTCLRGMMLIYGVLCQYRTSDGGSKVLDLGVDGQCAWRVHYIRSIKKDDGSTYYIVKTSRHATSDDGYMWMDGFAIDHDTLRNVSVYDASDDLDECGMEANYFIRGWNSATDEEGEDWLFDYDTETKSLYVPITLCTDDDDIPIATDRYTLYTFDGMEFVDKGEVPHKGLHASLSSYKRLAKYFRTEKYIVRVDETDDGTYRYASWKASSNMGEKPELVIYGGSYDEEGDCYTFFNDGFEYVAGYTEVESLPDSFPFYYKFLLVKKNGKILLKEKEL